MENTAISEILETGENRKRCIIITLLAILLDIFALITTLYLLITSINNAFLSLILFII
jgi:hypothetical protein